MSELNPIPTPAYTPTSAHNADTFTPRAHQHNDPTGVFGFPIPSSIGNQNKAAFYIKSVMVEAARQRKFGALASTISMPQHQGKRIRGWHFLPLLDDRNMNDQGIDARGVQIRNGNLYGSTKDIGKIVAALPVITETGGRVNRVGFQRREIEGTFNSFGFFYEWTDEFEMFDSDPSVLQRMYREAMIGAEKIQEDMLQIDILNGAGTLIYAGGAVSDDTMDDTCQLSYKTLQRLDRALTAVRTPKHTKIIKGSTMTDTRTLTSTRFIFVGSEVIPLLENMRDNFGNPALIKAHQYAAATTLLPDEIGAIGNFRFVEVEEMKHWAGAGAAADPNKGMYATDGKYDIFPLLCVGEDAFSTIGFQTSGTGNHGKITVKTMKPGTPTRDDPYGKIGLTSLFWYYGIMFQRPERIGLIKTVAPF